MTRYKPLIPPGTAPRGTRGNTQPMPSFSFWPSHRRPWEQPTSSKLTWRDFWLILLVSAIVIGIAIGILYLFGHLL